MNGNNQNAFNLVLVRCFLYQISETRLNEVGNIETRLEMQNWMVLFPATGHIRICYIWFWKHCVSRYSTEDDTHQYLNSCDSENQTICVSLTTCKAESVRSVIFFLCMCIFLGNRSNICQFQTVGKLRSIQKNV